MLTKNVDMYLISNGEHTESLNILDMYFGSKSKTAIWALMETLFSS